MNYIFIKKASRFPHDIEWVLLPFQHNSSFKIREIKKKKKQKKTKQTYERIAVGKLLVNSKY
jgi:hypothetical protein